MTTVTCSNCGRQGHKYPTCAQPLKPELALRKSKHKSNRSQHEAGSSATATTGVAASPATPPGPSPPAPPAPRKAPAPKRTQPVVGPVRVAFKPPRSRKPVSTSSAPMTRLRKAAHDACRPARTTAGQKPSRYADDAGTSQPVRGKIPPVRGRRQAGVQAPRLWLSMTEGGGCK